ncbi:efflux RND transporter permease subunit [Rhodopila sp.]|uniref:efflux RND transporter permease subunit n=1 Tax=Rhodopila sp. TaxID=2480087 RepID=UPI003D0A768C
MQRFFAALVARRWLILVLALGVVGAGWLNLRQLAIDAVPDISPKQVLILTKAQGLGPLEVERLVTFPIETQMAGLPLLKDVRSKSRFGLSAVYVTFEDAADVQTARAEVFERLQQARAMMPPGVGTPEEGPLSTGLGEILEFELRGPGYTPMQLYQMLQWRIVPQLRLVPGIVGVDIYGGDLQTYEVQVSPERLRAQGITLPQVFAAIESNNTTRGGAYIERGDDQEIVRGLALAQSQTDIAGIVLKTAPLGGVPVTVGDVAEVKLAPKVRLGAVTHDGKGETVLGVADMQYGLNASEVLPALSAKINELQKKLPAGVEIHTFYDRSTLVNRAIHTVEHNLGEGALLVIAVLMLMLGSLRAGLIVATVIPLAMMMAFAGMRAFGISGNLMSLGAIDFGLIVDGAVVLVENVLRRQANGEGDGDPVKVVPAAAAEVARPVIFSVLIITLVYLPVLSLQSVEGKMFRPMALTVMLALLSALLVTILVMPALAATFLGPTKAIGKNGRQERGGKTGGKGGAASDDTFVVRWARKGYTPVLRRTERHPYITAGIAVVLFAGAVFLATRLGGEFIPQLAEGSIVVTSTKLPSINLDASIRVVTEIEKVLRGFPDVQTVVSQTGSAAVPTDPMGVQSTDSYVILKPPGQWKTAHTQSGLLTAFEKRLKAAVPGVSFEFSQPIQMRMDDLLQGVRSDVALTIFGEDLGKLKTLADQAVNIVKGIKGAADVRAEQQGGLPALTVRVDRQRLSRYGINAADALAVVEAIGGRTVGTVYGQNDTETPIVVRLPPAARASAERVRDLPVGLADGQAVPLSAVADITVADGPAEVIRDKLQRRIAVQINVRGRDVQSFVTEAEKTVQDKIKLPQGYSVDWTGMFQNLQSATQRLSLVVPGVLAVIFLMLYLNFGTLRLAGLIFLNVPMAAIGGIAALTLRGMPFSVSAGIGFIATFGIAILDGVVLASYIEQERTAGKNARDAAREAAEKRLRPVLTTALVASLGFIPMAVSTTAGAEVQRPLATVVIGGLVTATLLTLLVLPSLYPVVTDARLPSWRKVKGWFGSRKQHHPAE